MNPYVNAYKKHSAEYRNQVRRHRFSSAVILVFLMLALCFVLVYKRTVGQQLLLETQALKARYTELVTENSVLLGRKQAQLSRERIAAYARDRLGLRFPDPEQIRWISLDENPFYTLKGGN